MSKGYVFENSDNTVNRIFTWIKITKTYADLSAAALTNDIEFYSLPAKTVINSVLFKHSTSFQGGSIATYTLSVGFSGSLLYLSGGVATDVNQAPGDAVYGQSNNGTPILKSFANATSVRLSAISTGANLDQATQGSVDIWIAVSNIE